MIGVYRRWRAARNESADRAVLAAVKMLRPSQAFALPIMRLAHLGPGRTYPALARLERRGVVSSQWTDGPYPRRRLYRVAKAEFTAAASGAES